MYSMIPYRRAQRTLISRPMDDFIRSFFDANDLFGSAGFQVDVRDSEGAYLLSAELPGVPKEKVNLSVENDVLTISADLNHEKTEQREGYLYSERRSGHVQRHFNLEGIDASSISASYENGVLNVSLPKKGTEAKAEARKIDIE